MALGGPGRRSACMSPPDRTSPSVLVTGATGLVGTDLVDQLRANSITVVGVSRRGRSADRSVLAWDMASEEAPSALRRPWDVIVHAAANTRWTTSPEEATAANVATVRAVEPLVAPHTHVIHVSTAYASGLRGDVESPDMSDYRNTYEWSKAHAERVAREAFSRLTVVRPPLIVGRRCDGRAARFSGMYTLIRGLTVGTVPAVVANPDARFDAIPVDELCRLLIDLIGSGGARAGSVLTIAAGSAAPTVEEAIGTVVGALNGWRQRHSREPLECPRLISPESWNRFFRPFVQEHLTPRQLLVLELLGNFEPYLALAEPLRPDYTVENVLPCLATSTNYWAEANSRVAALSPSRWRNAPQGRSSSSRDEPCPK